MSQAASSGKSRTHSLASFCVVSPSASPPSSGMHTTQPNSTTIQKSTVAPTNSSTSAVPAATTSTRRTTTNDSLPMPASAMDLSAVTPGPAQKKALGMATTAKAEGAPSGGMPPSNDSTEPRTTGGQPALQDPSVLGTPSVTMSPVSTEAGSQAPGHATALPSTTKPGVSPLVVSTSFQVTGQTSPKTPEGQQHSVSTGSPVPVTDSSFSTPRGMPTTLSE